MLKNIKSIFFFRLIFSNLKEKQKLKIAKYSKNLQNKIDINLSNYKLFSGRYIIYENGKRKEYDAYRDILVFEGEYLIGKRNGKGKEYYDGKLKFEGEYLNGLRNGKGKEYNYKGNLIFEGEFLNGLRNGKGKGYDSDCKLIFEGEYLYGFVLKGKYYNNGILVYEVGY